MIVCKYCGGARNSVVDTRPAGNSIRRRRRCDDCDFRWSTIEVSIPMLIKVQEILNSVYKNFSEQSTFQNDLKSKLDRINSDMPKDVHR